MKKKNLPWGHLLESEVYNGLPFIRLVQNSSMLSHSGYLPDTPEITILFESSEYILMIK